MAAPAMKPTTAACDRKSMRKPNLIGNKNHNQITIKEVRIQSRTVTKRSKNVLIN